MKVFNTGEEQSSTMEIITLDESEVEDLDSDVEVLEIRRCDTGTRKSTVTSNNHEMINDDDVEVLEVNYRENRRETNRVETIGGQNAKSLAIQRSDSIDEIARKLAIAKTNLANEFEKLPKMFRANLIKTLEIHVIAARSEYRDILHRS